MAAETTRAEGAMERRGGKQKGKSYEFDRDGQEKGERKGGHGQVYVASMRSPAQAKGGHVQGVAPQSQKCRRFSGKGGSRNLWCEGGALECPRPGPDSNGTVMFKRE